MAKYVDGFVLPIPRKNVKKYQKIARMAGKVWKEHGALEYIECMADDVKPGQPTSFPQSVKLKAGEVVFLSCHQVVRAVILNFTARREPYIPSA
ncbi:MAG: DUF1428 domain-containing protein [Bdellovibrionaceae bacterium]|nr:DUF1428 domain-containing protein [Pseudobdellovibrionaceae bacterium]